MPQADKDLWKCPKCGEKFAGKNMWHSCGDCKLEDLFDKSDPIVFETYRALEKMALKVAPFHVIPQKTRICFQMRIRCAGGTPMKSFFRAAFLFPRVVNHERIYKVESFNAKQHGHYVKLYEPGDVDEQIRKWLLLSTECGEQRNIKNREPKPRAKSRKPKA